MAFMFLMLILMFLLLGSLPGKILKFFLKKAFKAQQPRKEAKPAEPSIKGDDIIDAKFEMIEERKNSGSENEKKQ